MTHTAEPMTLTRAIAMVEVRNEMRGDSGRYPSGEGWGYCYQVDGYWIPKEAWKAIDAELAKQRNAVEVIAWRNVDGRDVWTINPTFGDSFDVVRADPSVVASRDREDAKHQLRDLHRAIESNLTGTFIEQGKSPTEYKEGLIKAYGHCRDMVSRRIDAIRAVRNAVDAACRENKP